MGTDMRSAPTMTIFKLRSEWAYISGRVAAMMSRPLILLALKQWGGNELAATVAVIFLVVMLTSAFSAFDTHRGFYQTYFGAMSPKGVQRAYRLYCSATTLQGVAVSPLLFGFISYRFGDTILAVLVVAFFASERLADEAQRFLIFEGLRREWGLRILVKALMQISGVSLCVFIFGSDASHVVVALFLAGNLVAYGSKFPWRYVPTNWQSLRAGAIACLNQRLFWLLSLITTSISYLDRVVVMLFQQSDMAVYTILVSSMSIVQNAVEYFFMSLRRKEILQGQLSLSGVFLSGHFYRIVGFAALLGSGASWVMLRFYNDNQNDHMELVPIVLLSQVALSVSLVLREIIYWNHSVIRLAWLEGSFITFTLVAAAVMRSSGIGYEVVLGMISVLFTLRMCLLIWDIVRSHDRSPIP